MESIVQHQANSIISKDDIVKDGFDLLRRKSQRLRSTSTKQDKISLREGKQGKTFKYVKGKEFEKWLDMNYPGWSWEVDIINVNQLGGFVSVRGTLTVHDPDTGFKRVMSRIGSKEAIIVNATNQLAVMPYLKSAETDALKRCCVALGAFNDVYSDVDFEDGIDLPESDWQYYFESVFPVLQEKGIPYSKIINQIRSLLSGIIKIEELKGLT